MSGLSAVTGAFGYSGKYIAARLLSEGCQVITFTGHPRRIDPFSGQVKVFPFNFHQPKQLARDLQGVDTLYNSYWVRFEHGTTTFGMEVENSRTLFQAAKEAGVKRIVHISIANPTAVGAERLPYYRGKAALEEAVKATGIPHAIIRPTVIFSLEGILINNIAWLLKRIPVFAIPGSGNYQLQPVFVEDLARIAVDAGKSRQNMVVDAVGPETYTFSELVKLMATINKKHSGNRKPIIIHIPPLLALYCAKTVGLAIGDVLLTRDELAGLMANLLVSNQPPTGETSFKQWLAKNIQSLGAKYSSELKRHYS